MFADEEPKKPDVLSGRNLAIALALHAAFFLLAYLFAKVTFKPKETTIPIDLTVVVQENLDGNEDEPPPMRPPTPPPPAPPTPPKEEVKVTQQPKVEPKVDAVVKTLEKKDTKTPPKEVKPPKSEKPKKTAEQIRKEKEERERKRIEAIRNRGKVVKTSNQPPPKERQPNGRTGKQTRTDIEKLLNQGYRPGRTDSIAANEYQRCVSLIQKAFYSQWDRPPWTDTLREMHLSIQLGANGRILGYKLVQGSSDAKADATVLQAASRVKIISGLSSEFISQNKTVTIRFKVTPQ